MEPKDLMIGDYIYRMDFNTPVPTKIIGVEVINYDKMEYVVDILNKNGYIVQLYLNEIKPIPLTSDILEKNGFKLNPQGSYSIGRNISIDILDGRYNANMNTNNPKASSFLYQVGKYVHELQHALRLCGIDKEIEL